MHNLRTGLQPLTQLYTLHDLTVKSNVDENHHTCAGAIPVLMGIHCTLVLVCRIYGIASRISYPSLIVVVT
jgi:hypothetical protein